MALESLHASPLLQAKGSETAGDQPSSETIPFLTAQTAGTAHFAADTAGPISMFDVPFAETALRLQIPSSPLGDILLLTKHNANS